VAHFQDLSFQNFFCDYFARKASRAANFVSRFGDLTKTKFIPSGGRATAEPPQEIEQKLYHCISSPPYGNRMMHLLSAPEGAA
jgi:hypothetical protein